ncbi:MAG: PH domain-containing protein [Methanobrevibacter sp.]|uniref:PH domain-containing protein n=1 Tax=Methanobrevibacter sp. TaxID=66852 RepID=UPI0025CE2337|nr:PH domain-containing protein [Methanobrevibacter sp.]MBQ8018270.1 PH domain-containing protein [Methanobrevibacter sp.]
MLFSKNDGKANERILYKTKPNMLLGCKKAFYGIILLIIILTVSPMVIRFIGQMQVYMISQIKLSLTRYTAIAFFVVILINVIYIIWQLIGWYAMEYTLTESKIIIKSGVLSTKKNYMPYATIQDINTSQGILARLFNVGTVSVFSAYDNNELELKNISNPSEAEEIIFSRMGGPRSFQAPPQSMPQYSERNYIENNEYPSRNDPYFNDDYSGSDDYLGRNEYYDEYEPITPITHERNSRPRRDYEYYPEDIGNMNNHPRHTYEYEPYDTGLNRTSNDIHSNTHYNKIDHDYSYRQDDYYQNNDSQNHYNEHVEKSSQNDQEDIGSSEHVIQRHFDKFKK